jgi:hypothetical protein
LRISSEKSVIFFLSVTYRNKILFTYVTNIKITIYQKTNKYYNNYFYDIFQFS